MAQTGYTPISLYYSSTASATPTAGNLVPGELAINTADGKLFYKDSAGVVQVIAGKGGAGVAGGSNTQVQYNSSGSLAGSANFTFNGTTVTIANDASISGLTVGKGGGSQATTTSFGYQAQASSDAGNNTAVGYQSLYNNTGNYNTAVGFYSLLSNTSGVSNSSFGPSALRANTTGSYNTSIGDGSLRFNTTANNNTAIGYQAGYSNTTGAGSVFIGYTAGYNTTTGGGSTIVGYQAGYNNTTQTLTAFGMQAGFSHTTGTQNTFVGHLSGYSTTTASNNTALGNNALYTATGANNTSIGQYSGFAVTTGTENTFLGQASGSSITTGRANTIIGRYSGNAGGLDIRTASNYIVLSDGDGNPRVIVDNNGKMSVGGTSNLGTIGAIQSGAGGYCMGTSAVVNGGTYYHMNFLEGSTGRGSITSNGTTTSYNITSDARLKENIVNAKSALSKIDSIQIRCFDWKDSKKHEDFGVIAQELHEVAPEAVTKGETEKDMWSVDYSKLVPSLIKYVQELKAEVDSLKQQLAAK